MTAVVIDARTIAGARAGVALLGAADYTEVAAEWVSHARDCRAGGDREGCADAWQRARYSAMCARIELELTEVYEVRYQDTAALPWVKWTRVRAMSEPAAEAEARRRAGTGDRFRLVSVEQITGPGGTGGTE